MFFGKKSNSEFYEIPLLGPQYSPFEINKHNKHKIKKKNCFSSCGRRFCDIIDFLTCYLFRCTNGKRNDVSHDLTVSKKHY